MVLEEVSQPLQPGIGAPGLGLMHNLQAVILALPYGMARLPISFRTWILGASSLANCMFMRLSRCLYLAAAAASAFCPVLASGVAPALPPVL